MKEINGVKERIVEVLKILIYKGLIKTSGHVSARVSDDRFLITGHIHEGGRSLRGMNADDIVLCDLKGKKLEGKADAPGEVYMHSCIYTLRKDVNSVIHNHPLYSTVLAIAQRPVLPVYTSGVIFAPSVPVLDDPDHIDTEEKGMAMAKVLGKAPAILIRGHGNVVAGASLEHAAAISLRLEDNSQIQLLACLAGEPRPILPNEIKGQLAKMLSIAPATVEALLNFYKEEMEESK
ncbi:MAG: class II aldolase/adducin family protein [Thermodesulfobacteriota bacterium]